MHKIIQSSTDLPNYTDDIIAFDVETTAFNDKTKALNSFLGPRICGYGFGNTTHQWYLPIRHNTKFTGELEHNFDAEQAAKFILDLLKKRTAIIGHNIKYDMRFLYHELFKEFWEIKSDLYDTVVFSRVVRNDLMNYSLSSLSREFLKSDDSVKFDFKVKAYLKSVKSKDYAKMPINKLGEYCCKDVELTYKLYEYCLEQEYAETLWAMETQVTRILLDAEIGGAKIDRQRLIKEKVDCMKILVNRLQEIRDIVGWDFDPSKNSHMAKYFIVDQDIVPPLTEKGNPSFTKHTLPTIDHPIIPHILEFNEEEHFLNNSLDAIQTRLDGKDLLHANFRQCITTGRMSCADPNLQNQSKRSKVLFIPEEGHSLVSVDFSQIEFRIFTHYSGDQNLLNAYLDDPFADFHQKTADFMGFLRDWSKTWNFSAIYGVGKGKMILQMKTTLLKAGEQGKVIVSDLIKKRNVGFIPENKIVNDVHNLTERDWGSLSVFIYDYFHKGLPSIKSFQAKVRQKLFQRPYIRNFYGRRFYIPAELAYIGVNYLCQGTAADLIKTKMIECAPIAKQFGASLVTQVHDELLFSCPKENVAQFAPRVVEAMETNCGFRVPIIADCEVSQTNWAEAKKYPIDRTWLNANRMGSDSLSTADA